MRNDIKSPRNVAMQLSGIKLREPCSIYLSVKFEDDADAERLNYLLVCLQHFASNVYIHPETKSSTIITKI